jgi:sorbitol-specific phosphotransferase system component IIA
MGAEGVGADDHALNDRMWIAFDDGTVHERARVSLVGVADHDSFDAAMHRGIPAGFPLDAGRESAMGAGDVSNLSLHKFCKIPFTFNATQAKAAPRGFIPQSIQKPFNERRLGVQLEGIIRFKGI